MLDTNYQNSSCAFAEQIVSYLYGEVDKQDKAKFELHLTNCGDCADELAGFGFVRSSIQEWRQEEFLQLAIPAMEIPFEKSPEISISSTEKRSWLADLRQLLTLSPTWATAATAFAALAVCVGLTLVAVNFSGTTDVADNNDKPIKSVSYPTIEKKTEQNIEDVSAETAKQNSPDKTSKPSEQTSKSENAPRTEPKNLIVKVSNKAQKVSRIETIAQNSSISAPVRKVKDTNNINKTTVAKNQQVPKLADFDEVEDNSLRLSDLMAEVENK
ncbi:MAG: anti-sigma factor family protein [Pyrinomonadaceae bacterium]